MKAYEYRYILHQIPELGRKEYKTCQYILDVAKNFKCEVFRPTETGIVLYFNLNKEKTVALRADMDALPIIEKNDVLYKSKNPGVMHACGHDGHMAMLLETAEWCNNNIEKLENNVVFLFQPSEEDNAGAQDIIRSNILDDLKIDCIFGMHIWPTLEENKLYSMPLGMLASSSEVNIEILGKSAHAANRSNACDALLAGTKLINSYYDVLATFTKPHLISFGKINSGTARNIVADKCNIEATMRCYSDEDFIYMKDELLKIKKNIEKELGVEINVMINSSYPSVINNRELYNELKDTLNINLLKSPFLQAEDFGCYTRKYKALFMLLGCGNKALLHTPTFDFNTDILATGVEAYKKILMHQFE